MRSPSVLADRTRQCYYELLAMTSKSTIALGDALVGFRGRIRKLVVDMTGIGLPGPELERRLIELGFVEGADVELLHQGLFGGDPIAVRVAHTTIALRRREAMAILVTPALPA
jgi:ferrous iron transport protein A